MKVYRKSAVQSLADRLGQALVEHMDIGKLYPDFFHVELKPDGGFFLNIICNAEKDMQNNDGGLYKSLGKSNDESRFEFEFTPLTTPVTIAGKTYGYLLNIHLGWLWGGAKLIIETVLGAKILFQADGCYSECIVDPTAKPDDFYVNMGFVHRDLESRVNIPVLISLYNQKFNKTHVTLQDLLSNFWRDQFMLNIDDIKSLTVNGLPLGEIVTNNTYGKFWAP